MASEKVMSRSQRNSSIELYRIIATFAVLIVHFNGWFVGDWPLPDYDINNPTLFRTCQMTISAVSVICVNMFIIISGYFGIRLKFSSIVKLCVYLGLIYIPLCFLKFVADREFSMAVLIERSLVISYAGYFIQCYFMLMIVSPVLNSFIDKYGRDILKWVLVFWFLEFWFSCVTNVEELGYNRGYSVIHFVLMYMIARCIRLYEDDLRKVRPSLWVLGYLLSTLLIIAGHVVGIKWCWDYSNPVVVFSAVCSFMPFLYMSYYNKVINWIARGTLAVYIIHDTYFFRSKLEMLDVRLLEANSYPVYLIKVLGVILLVFMASILYGNLCNYVSKRVSKGVDKRMNSIFEFK